MFSGGRIVKWDVSSSLNDQQLAEMCSSIHELTGHGPAKIREAKFVDAYLKFNNSKYRPNLTQVLSCTEDNKRQHTFHVTQGIENTGVTLVKPEQRRIKGKEVYTIGWTTNQVRIVPTLQAVKA